MASKGTNERVRTPIGRVSYEYCTKPDKHGKYRVTLWVDPNDPKNAPRIADLKRIAGEVKAMMWPKWPEGLTQKQQREFNQPMRIANADDIELNAECEGMLLIQLKSYDVPPGLVKINPSAKTPPTVPINDPKEFYSGCYALVSTTAFAYDSEGSMGVSFCMQNVCKMGDGDPLGAGKVDPDTDFGDLDPDEHRQDNSHLLEDGGFEV